MPPSPNAPRTALALLALLALALLAPAAWGAPSIAGTRAEIRELGRQVAELDARAGAAAQAHNQAIDRLEAATALLRETRRELRGAREDLAAARERLAERIVGVYVTGQPTFVEVLLTSGSLTEAEQADDLLDQIARGDAGAVARVRARRARLEDLEARRAEAEAARERELAAAAARRGELEGLLSERRRLLSDARTQLRRLIKEERERRARLAALAKARQAALASLPVAGATALPAAPPAGGHLFPVAGPARFSNDWMAGRAGGRYHEGIDIFAERGTPVVAVADGSLYNVGYNGLGGWRLWLRDGPGNTFYYAHLSAYSPAASEGAAVARGTVIGYVGDSGDARGTSPHLHFQIHPGGGGPVPPYTIISGWPRAG